MLQDLHTVTPLPASDANDMPAPDIHPRSPAAPPFSANTYAERLMDELFEEVEQLLHLDAPPAAIADPAADALAQPFPETEVRADLDPAMPLATRPEAIALQPSADLLIPPLAAITADGLTTPAPVPAPAIAPQRAWERFMLAVGCVSIVVTLGLWWWYLAQQQRQQLAGVAPVGTGATVSLADQKFADYLQKSLEHIAPQSPAPAGVATTPGSSVTVPGMPNVVIPQTPGTAPVATPPTGTGTERVYVPVYQLPSNLYPPGTVKPLPNLPTAGKPAASVGGAQATNSNPTGVVRRLVGVLEQGNGSVALFEINGVTQRYELGESIGSSGWTLVEVSKNQAIIRRNGDVRSLFVGHSF